ncbi:MAG: hypothetical protein HZR80_16925 [Candidatus Heimdallarchaeota archaeon]
MSTTKIDVDLEAKKKLTILVAKKYGKTRAVLGKEATEAIKEHCKKLEDELELGEK